MIYSQWGQAGRRTYLPSPIRPNFFKPLPFAVVVAENVDGIILAQPAMKLVEKFAALRLGNLQFRRAFGQRTKGIERMQRSARWGERPREPALERACHSLSRLVSSLAPPTLSCLIRISQLN